MSLIKVIHTFHAVTELFLKTVKVIKVTHTFHTVAELKVQPVLLFYLFFRKCVNREVIRDDI